jgi:hypothetical protein
MHSGAAPAALRFLGIVRGRRRAGSARRPAGSTARGSGGGGDRIQLVTLNQTAKDGESTHQVGGTRHGVGARTERMRAQNHRPVHVDKRRLAPLQIRLAQPNVRQPRRVSFGVALVAQRQQSRMQRLSLVARAKLGDQLTRLAQFVRVQKRFERSFVFRQRVRQRRHGQRRQLAHR